MVITILTVSFLFLYAVLIFFYFYQWKKIESPISKGDGDVFISVIIAARNEEKHLPHLLKDLQKQKYSPEKFEVIVVDDYSTDKTSEVVLNFGRQNFRVISPNVSTEISSKKTAIANGVAEAKGELILVTDADCRVNNNWIKSFSNFYSTTPSAFIAAPVKYQHDDSLFQIFQSLDFMMLQGITAASVWSHFHNMCNGANLAYTKEAFDNVNGFEGIDHIATGDDMLLMHKIWKQQPDKVFYLKNKDVIVTTQPAATMNEFFMQRKRWASKSLVYEDYKIIAVLGFVYLFNSFFFVLITISLFDTNYLGHTLIFLISKTLIEFPFIHSVSNFFEEKKLLKYYLFFQPLHMFYTVVVGFLSQFGKYEWKGRKIR